MKDGFVCSSVWAEAGATGFVQRVPVSGGAAETDRDLRRAADALRRFAGNWSVLSGPAKRAACEMPCRSACRGGSTGTGATRSRFDQCREEGALGGVRRVTAGVAGMVAVRGGEGEDGEQRCEQEPGRSGARRGGRGGRGGRGKRVGHAEGEARVEPTGRTAGEGRRARRRAPCGG